MPPHPAFTANPARRNTWASTLPLMPISSRSVAASEVSTVTASTVGLLADCAAASAAACSIREPPEA